MRKTLFALPCMAAIALAAFVGMRTLQRNNISYLDFEEVAKNNLYL